MSNLEILEERLGHFLNKLNHVETKIDNFDKALEEKYLTKTEFQPVKLLVYGFAGIVFTGFVVALLTIVIK